MKFFRSTTFSGKVVCAYVWEKTDGDFEITSIDSYEENRYGLSNDTKISPPNLTPSPHLGGRKHEKNAKNWFHHFQMIKLCGEVFPIENFQRQSCSHICLEDISEKNFEICA